MRKTPRAAAAALIRERAPVILPRAVADAAAGDASECDTLDLQPRLTIFLGRRIPLWGEALEDDNNARCDAIGRLLQTDAAAAAADTSRRWVLPGTVAIGYRVIEAEIRAKADAYAYSPDELWTEVDLLRRTVVDMRRADSDGGRVA